MHNADLTLDSSSAFNSAITSPPAPAPAPGNAFTYTAQERLPVEVLVFRMSPAHVQEFLDLDHQIWTLGEALQDPFGAAWSFAAPSSAPSDPTATEAEAAGAVGAVGARADNKLPTAASTTRKIPFLSKEVWLDDREPGTVTLHFVWASRQQWVDVSGEKFQKALQAAFDGQVSK